MAKFSKFFDFGVPFTPCNLDCNYCYVRQRERIGGRGHTHGNSLNYPIEHIAQALSAKRLGGESIVNLCAAGETMLPEYIPQLIKSLLQEGHFVMVVTNATLTEQFIEISKFEPALLDRLFFKCSLQLLELKRLELLDVFFENIRLIKKIGASFTVEVTPVDELETHINEIIDICSINVGALPHLSLPRHDESKELKSRHSLHEFAKIWGVFNSPMFDFKVKYWGEKRNEFCYAGKHSFLINGSTGDFYKCYMQGISQNLYEDITIPIDFEPVGYNCKMSHCFNAHVLLALGCIPEINDVTYADVRDRIDSNTGENWLNPTMHSVFSQRFRNT